MPADSSEPPHFEMDRCIMDEMYGNIYCDPDFAGNLLAVKNEHAPLMETVLRNCPTSFNRKLKSSTSGEHSLYKPIVDVLNSIKEAVDTVRKDNHLGTLGQAFRDHHAHDLSSQDPQMSHVRPDLVMFEGAQAAWETLVMPIEIKAKMTYLKVGMKKLARYAYGILSHQIHRRYVYGMVICRWAATFVRFDRSGILHSKPIDMRKQPDEFRRAFAGLMMLDRDGFGYDTAFSTELTPDGEVEYYVDLPEYAFLYDEAVSEPEIAPLASANYPTTDDNDASSQQGTVDRQLPTRRFKVMERLCHRKSICGRATIVLRIREARKRTQGQGGTVEPPSGHRTRRFTTQQTKLDKPEWEEVPGANDYVLKMIWRSPNKQPEGEVLERLGRAHGVPEYLWHSDKLKQGATCHKSSSDTCDTCHDITPIQPVQTAINLCNLNVEVMEEEKEGRNPQHAEVDTDTYTEELNADRAPRIYNWMLLRSVGRPLCTARDTRELLEVILDGILGYWHALNRGILHRDITHGNVLILIPEVGRRVRTEPISQNSSQAPTVPEGLKKSEELLQKAVARISRGSRGFLGDYDLYTTHGGLGPWLFGQPSKRKAREPGSPTRDTGVTLEAGPRPKRHKRNDQSTLVAISNEKSRDLDLSQDLSRLPPTVSDGKRYKPLDFRTGTPTFMSSRVLQIGPGERFRQTHEDDLESFFWLIYWCTIQHTDPGRSPNDASIKFLGELDPLKTDWKDLGLAKLGILSKCHSGEIYKDLKSCKNAWADDPILAKVIQQLGSHFSGFNDNVSDQSGPEDQLLKIVDVITKALEETNSDGDTFYA